MLPMCQCTLTKKKNVALTKQNCLLKNFASMIRYSCNNLDGKFALIRTASALGVTEEVVEILWEIFSDCGMIKIVDRNEDFYQIEFLLSVEISKALHTQKYAEFYEDSFCLLEFSPWCVYFNIVWFKHTSLYT